MPRGDEATFVRDELADVPEVSVVELEVATAAAAVAVAAARHEQVDVQQALDDLAQLWVQRHNHLPTQCMLANTSNNS